MANSEKTRAWIDQQPQPAPVAAGRARRHHQTWAWAGLERAEQPHHRRQHERRQQHVPDHATRTITGSRSATDTTGSCSSRPLSAIDRGADERRARRRSSTTATAVGLVSWRIRPATYADDDQGQRPAAGDVVGRRGEVEQHAGDEAEDGGLLGPADQRGGDDDEQAEVGHDAVPGDVREERDLQDQGDDDQADRHQPAHGAHRASSQAPVGLDHGAVGLRCRTAPRRRRRRGRRSRRTAR